MDKTAAVAQESAAAKGPTWEHFFMLLLVFFALAAGTKTWLACVIAFLACSFGEQVRIGVRGTRDDAGLLSPVVIMQAGLLSYFGLAQPFGREALAQAILCSCICTIVIWRYGATFANTTRPFHSLECVAAGVMAGIIVGAIFVGVTWQYGVQMPLSLGIRVLIVSLVGTVIGALCVEKIRRSMSLMVHDKPTFLTYVMPVAVAVLVTIFVM